MLLEKQTLSQPPQPPWVRQGTQLGNRFHYRQKESIPHNSLNLFLLTALLTVVAGLFYLGLVTTPFLYIPFAAVGFGLVYFMLFILVVHEASHQMFIVLKNLNSARTWNRCFGWITCLPFGVDYLRHWEVGHHIHHCHPVEPQDPQNCPETIYTGNKLLKYLAKVLLIPGYAILRIDYSCPAEKEYRSKGWLSFTSALIWIITMGLETLYLHWQVAAASFWGIQILVMFNTLKITLEHGGAIGRREETWLRSCSSVFPLRQLLMPFNISLHFEHHLNYGVPWYDLMKYHRSLKAIVPPEIHADVFNANLQVWQQIRAK